MHNAKEAKNGLLKLKNEEEDFADHPPYREVYKLPSRQFNDHYLA